MLGAVIAGKLLMFSSALSGHSRKKMVSDPIRGSQGQPHDMNG